MKELHESLDMVLEAKSRGVEKLSIEFNISVQSVRVYHLDDKFKIVKSIHSYYGGICSGMRSEDGITVPFTEFNGLLKQYLESCE